jgi:hypothetical protein
LDFVLSYFFRLLQLSAFVLLPRWLCKKHLPFSYVVVDIYI